MATSSHATSSNRRTILSKTESSSVLRRGAGPVRSRQLTTPVQSCRPSIHRKLTAAPQAKLSCRQQGAMRVPSLTASPAVCGRQLVPSHAAPPRPQRIFAAAFRRGNKLVVCATLAGASAVSRVEDLLSMEVSPNKDMVSGQLENGLQYVILPNKLPPERFEAHLEIHAGSVDEQANEQGVAHLVEHVTFLGSKKREALLGTGARANAYTDFHHTVFHVHAPLKNSLTEQPMLPQVLEALVEVAFQPQFLPTRIEKERLAVLAEAQMMNTIEYRVDCQLLQHLHYENALGCRFPIGKIEQVKEWEYPLIQEFWRRWYFPANATLYLIGDMDTPVQRVEQMLAATFGKVPTARETLAIPPPSAPTSTNGNTSTPPTPAPRPEDAPIKQRHKVRPPVEHIYGTGPLAPSFSPAEVKIFRHPLLQTFNLSVFCKLQLNTAKSMSDLKRQFMLRIILSVFTFRVNRQYTAAAEPSFHDINLDISDSGREGCAVSTLTVIAEPKDWEKAVDIAVQEMRRLQRFGVTAGELDRYVSIMLRDSEQASEQADAIPSAELVDFMMECRAMDHTFMDQRLAHDHITQVADTVTLDQVNAMCRSLLSFASDYGAEGEVLKAAAASPELYAESGPTRATAIVACIPAFMDSTGASISQGAAPSGRGIMGASGHLDADTIDLAALEAQAAQADEIEIPPDAVRFDITAEDIGRALMGEGLEVEATEDIEAVEYLIEPEALQQLLEERNPRFVALKGEGAEGSERPEPEETTGIHMRRLSNGVRVNFRQTDNEPKSAMIRVLANGGRSSEKPSELSADGVGAVVVGVRAMAECGRFGDFTREQCEVFCVTHLINCSIDADEENIVMDMSVAVSNGGLRAALELVHMFVEHPRWDEAAMERAKALFLSHVRSSAKSLERATGDRVIGALFGPDLRFRDVPAEALKVLDLEHLRSAVEPLLSADNIEVSIVGDFDEAELEELVLQYLGTIRPQPKAPRAAEALFHIQDLPLNERHTIWHLQDSDERACAYIAGPAPMRWGPFGSTEPPQPPPHEIVAPAPLKMYATAAEKTAHQLMRRAHPVYSCIILMLLQEIINSRLFTTVRDSLGLTYDVSFEITAFERIRTAWFAVNVTSYPDKIQEALAASIEVLRDVAVSPISHRELMRARRTVLTRHESDLKMNVYWIGLLTHLQNDQVPLKTVEVLRDLVPMYEMVTVQDIHDCYLQFNFADDAIFTCVGTSGKSAPPEPELPFYMTAKAGEAGLGGGGGGGGGRGGVAADGGGVGSTDGWSRRSVLRNVRRLSSRHTRGRIPHAEGEADVRQQRQHRDDCVARGRRQRQWHPGGQQAGGDGDVEDDGADGAWVNRANRRWQR